MRFGIADDGDPFLGDIGGNVGVFFRASQAEQAQPGRQRDAGQGIELLLAAAGTRVVAFKVLMIVRGKLANALPSGPREFVKLANVWRRQNQRPVFGADRVVGGDDAGPALPVQIFAVHEVQNHVAGAKFENQSPPCSFDHTVFLAARSAYDRRDLRECDRAAWRSDGGGDGLAVSPDEILGE